MFSYVSRIKSIALIEIDLDQLKIKIDVSSEYSFLAYAELVTAVENIKNRWWKYYLIYSKHESIEIKY